MKRIMFMGFLFLSTHSLVFAQNRTSDTELPLVAKTAIQELERTIQQAKKKTVEKLRAAMKSEMQMGNLDRANRINQEILRISEIPDNGLAGDPKDPVTGEWQTQAGVVYIFGKNQTVRCANGWSGTWKVEDKKVFIVLNVLHGQTQDSSNQYYYDLPVAAQEGDKRGNMVMIAQHGYEDLTLYGKR